MIDIHNPVMKFDRQKLCAESRLEILKNKKIT